MRRPYLAVFVSSSYTLSTRGVNLQFAKSLQVLEVHRAASMGSARLHRRLYHAGYRRIPLWQP